MQNWQQVKITDSGINNGAKIWVHKKFLPLQRILETQKGRLSGLMEVKTILDTEYRAQKLQFIVSVFHTIF